MIIKNRFIVLFSAIALPSYAQTLPPVSGEVVRHTYYTLDYNEQHEQPNWVFYRLTIDNVKGTAKRKNNFRPDPAVSTGSAQLSDYKGSGYDRGHLCPAADMKQSSQAMSETFYLSNMSPQVPSFNRGVWAKLEAEVRKQIKDEDDTLYVITGPIFLGADKSIGASEVTVPTFFFKMFFAPGGDTLVYILPNRAEVDTDLSKWRSSVEMVEALNMGAGY